MGRQVSFLMLPADEAEFLAALAVDGEVVLLRERSRTGVPEAIDRLPPQGSRAAREGTVLWNRSVSPEPVVKHLGPESFVIDKDNSEVVEIIQSEQICGVLRRGRIWAEMYSLDERYQAIPKSEGFVKWFNRISRWIRNHYTRDQHGTYVAPHAKAWADAGGTLS